MTNYPKYATFATWLSRKAINRLPNYTSVLLVTISLHLKSANNTATQWNFFFEIYKLHTTCGCLKLISNFIFHFGNHSQNRKIFKFTFKNSLLLPVYSFGYTYIHLSKYNTIHTWYTPTKLPPTFPGAPLKVNGAQWNIQRNPIKNIYIGIKGLIHYTHNSHACAKKFPALTHWCLVTHMCIGELGLHWSRSTRRIFARASVC